MHAIRQKLRPKNQVLVLKCYPQTTKGAVDVKPNSSELSYLLYYVTTRRSKVQKVGAFLEKKTASDVYHQRIGSVQVTLQILAALIEKAPRDLPLYARYVLRILNGILASKDITMVEATVPTFDVFCQHNDPASLAADQEYLSLYQNTINSYASYASTRTINIKTPVNQPLETRRRMAGLTAFKSVAAADALASMAGRQLNIMIPVLLENIWTDDHVYLQGLFRNIKAAEKATEEKPMHARRRSSVTAKIADSTSDSPEALSNSTADADRLAEEKIGILALSCLKSLFASNNRTQIRTATMAILNFISDREAENETLIDLDPVTGSDRGWATSMLMQISRWATVQDRYIIMVTTMDALLKRPVKEPELRYQFIIATMVGSLLRSEVNLIGLSVMDVLLGLIQHVLRVLQLEGTKTQLHQKTVGNGSPANANLGSALPVQNGNVRAATGTLPRPSAIRLQLLSRLQCCMGDLATHVYYADQISDMIAAILLRLKPPVSTIMPDAAAAVEDPDAASDAVAASANLVEDTATSGFFSFATAKITALQAIKSILQVANKPSKSPANAAGLTRNRVGLRVWEGTQWLLRDLDGDVRYAYVEALLTWLDKEATPSAGKALEDKPVRSRGLVRTTGDDSTGTLARRAVSNSARQDKPSRSLKATFLPLLHLAVYENALQFSHSPSEIALLYLLLTTLVDKLGVNAVSTGLPMIFRLQEDIIEEETLGKIHLGSICHGYFWALSDKFDFDSSRIGLEISSEILRRRSKGFWVDSIQYPPMPLSSLPPPNEAETPPELPIEDVESEALAPFDDRDIMVELIAAAYADASLKPASPPASPGRNFSHGLLPGNAVYSQTTSQELPAAVKEAMLAEWSREMCLAIATASSRTESLSGSRTGTVITSTRNYLTVLSNGNGNGMASGAQSIHSQQQRPSAAYLAGAFRTRRTSARDGSPMAQSDSSHNSVARIDHMKNVLSGRTPPSRAARDNASSSEGSMVSFDGTELSYAPTNGGDSAARKLSVAATKHAGQGSPSSRRVSVEQGRALSGNPPLPTPVPEVDETANKFERMVSIKPNPGTLPMGSTGPSLDSKAAKRAVSRGGQSVRSSAWGSETGGGVDLEGLLKGIDVKGRNGTMGSGTTVPPY